MKRLAGITTLLLLALPGSASASDPSMHELLSRVEVHYKPCPQGATTSRPHDLYGCAAVALTPETSAIYVVRYLRRGGRKAVRAHERAHFISAWGLDPEERVQIADAFGWPHWREERFANAWATCHLRARTLKRSKPRLGPRPPKSTCALMRTAAASVVCWIVEPASSFRPTWCEPRQP